MSFAKKISEHKLYASMYELNLCSQKYYHLCWNIQHIVFFVQVFCVDEIATHHIIY